MPHGVDGEFAHELSYTNPQGNGHGRERILTGDCSYPVAFMLMNASPYPPTITVSTGSMDCFGN